MRALVGRVMATTWGRRAFWVAGTLLAVLVALGVGSVVPDRPMIAAAAVAMVLALGVTVADPAAIPLLTMPLLLVVTRIGGGGLDLSVSDAVLAVSTVVALVFAPRPFSPALRNLLWLSALYQFATLFTVVANPYLANVVEWVHAWMLVAGALVVGWTVGRSGHARAGLTLIMLTSLALALITIVEGAVQYSSGDFGAVYVSWPYGMHKNFVGTVLGFAAVIAYTRPFWLGWSGRWAVAAFWILTVGVILTQSRQAIVGLCLALLVIVLRGDPIRKRSKAILLVVIPGLVLIATLVRDQLESGSEFNSSAQRLTWFQDTIEAWRQAPWFGYGLRFWSRDDAPFGFQPPNAEMEMLASAGIIGLVGFLVLIGGVLVVLWHLDPTYGTLAVAVILSRLVQGQFDLFWSAVQVSVPFVIAGICLGALAHHQEESPLPPTLLPSDASHHEGSVPESFARAAGQS